MISIAAVLALTSPAVFVNAEAPFETVRSNGSVDVEIRVDASATAPQFEVVGDEEAKKSVSVEVRGDELRISRRSGGWGGWGPGGQLKVRVRVPRLSRVVSSGSGDIEVAGFAGGSLELKSSGSGDMRVLGRVGDLEAKLSGSGDLEVEELDAKTVEITLRGSGDVELAGVATRLEIDLAGSGEVEGKRLEVQDLDVDIMGSGDVTVCARNNVRERTMGSGDVEIRCR